LPGPCLCLLLVACAGWQAGADYTNLPVAPVVELTDTPFFPQQAYQCGPAALATVVVSAGARVSPEALQPLVYIPERKGSLQPEMLVTPARYGLLGIRTEASLRALFELVDSGRPVVVLQNLGLDALPVWHYAVVIGYDLAKGEIYLRSGTDRRVSMSFGRFEKTWSRAGYWAMVVVPPDEVPVAVAPGNYLSAASSLERLREFSEARQAYQAAIRRWPDNALAWAGAGNVAYALSEFAGAESAYRQALRLSPENALLMNNLAMSLAEQGCTEQAGIVIDCALGRFPDVPVLGITAEEISRFSDSGAACRAFRCPFDAP
jgi:tetratricopeptide (TPR) repeat protein